MKLKQKFFIATTTILIGCMGGVVLFETMIRQITNQINDKIICDVYDEALKVNEQYHTQITGRSIAKLARLDKMVEMITKGKTSQNLAKIKNAYMEVKEAANLSHMIVLNRRFKVLINKSDRNGSFISSEILQSDLIRDLCRRAARSWDNHGTMISIDKIPAFAVASAVIGADDQTCGFVIGIVPLKFLAETLAQRVKAHITFETAKHQLLTGTSEEIFAVLTQKGPETVEAFKSIILKTGHGTFLTYAIPFFTDNLKEAGGHYLISKDFTAGYAMIENLTIAGFIGVGLVAAISIAACAMALQRLLSPLDQAKQVLNDILQNFAKVKASAKGSTHGSHYSFKKMRLLNQVAQSIGEINKNITEISTQTSLLDLNMVVQSAQSGKGATEVANEIKELAKQTAATTLDLKNRIDKFKNTENCSLTEITQSLGVISDVNEIVSTIASSVKVEDGFRKRNSDPFKKIF